MSELRISVVIPTCNRRDSLLRLLRSVNESSHYIEEVIVVDSGDEGLRDEHINSFSSIRIVYVKTTERSVCMQRNYGIHCAQSPWIFLCDDDLEVPDDYLRKIAMHINSHPEAGAVTGLVLQNNGKNGAWTHQYPVTSALDLCLRFLFQASVWGNIEVPQSNFVIRCVTSYYRKKGNHMSKAGWPVCTDFEGDFVKTPFYGLGASVVKKEWLINSPFDEVLDPNGIGDNYGVAAGFPPEGIHILTNAFVYHYRSPENRLHRVQSYYRRILALDYFLKTKSALKHVNGFWFLWSLIGNMTLLISPKSLQMAKVSAKLFFQILSGNNPYCKGKRSGAKIVTPEI